MTGTRARREAVASIAGGSSPVSDERGRRLALIAAIMGSFVAGLDATAVNVALPAIRVDLGGGLAGQQWVSNAYLLTLGSLILVGGSLGDVFGERRVFSVGVAGFGVVSIACALAPSIELLIVGRALDARRLSSSELAAVAQARRQTLARVDPDRAGREVSRAVTSASVHAFHIGIGISATLVALAGLCGLAGIRNPRRAVRCADCAGGQLAGQPLDAARDRAPATVRSSPAPSAPAKA